uniref:Ig-like domain-containing protein n=1 Tax=Pundamilia nyererei TaxID=303518 RepID=A0A3B4F6H1_9CICH
QAKDRIKHTRQSQLIGPLQPIIATAGEGITLPCHLVPGENVTPMTLEWTRPQIYLCRSSLFTDELKHGNVSLKLSKVKPADEGRYRCYIPDKDEEAFIDLMMIICCATIPKPKRTSYCFLIYAFNRY